ncbi:MAG: RDD family protein [Bacteroidota bacterium]
MNYIIRRFAAFYFDALIAMTFIVACKVLYILASNLSMSEVNNFSSDQWVLWQFISLFSYCFLFELLFKRTIGKMVFKFKIEGLYVALGTKLLIQVLIRTISRFIPFEPFSIFLDEDKMMWHDKLSKTKVIDIRKKI